MTMHVHFRLPVNMVRKEFIERFNKAIRHIPLLTEVLGQRNPVPADLADYFDPVVCHEFTMRSRPSGTLTFGAHPKSCFALRMSET